MSDPRGVGEPSLLAVLALPDVELRRRVLRVAGWGWSRESRLIAHAVKHGAGLGRMLGGEPLDAAGLEDLRRGICGRPDRVLIGAGPGGQLEYHFVRVVDEQRAMIVTLRDGYVRQVLDVWRLDRWRARRNVVEVTDRVIDD